MINYEKLSEDEQDDYIYSHITDLRCNGCGLAISHAFKVVPKNMSIIGKTLVLHLQPYKDTACKIRTCNQCGEHVNTVERICSACHVSLSPIDNSCPRCSLRMFIEVSSKCPSCGTPNKQELTKKNDF